MTHSECRELEKRVNSLTCDGRTVCFGTVVLIFPLRRFRVWKFSGSRLAWLWRRLVVWRGSLESTTYVEKSILHPDAPAHILVPYIANIYTLKLPFGAK